MNLNRPLLYSRDDETIVALCTPQGRGALALIRLSGNDARQIAASLSLLPHNKKLEDQPSHTIHLGWIIDHNQQPIDQVMLSVMCAPKTFTGQDTVEITAHNNQFIIEAIIEQAVRQGARLAHEGEFTKRAFLQGKIDLLQAEAIHDLIHAQTQATLKKSLSQLEGSFSARINELEKELITTLAWSEASFEFLDEEEEFGQQISEKLSLIIKKIADLKKNFSLQQQLRQGIRIAFIGAVNAGKSSLFNTLLGQKRSIVTSIAGTTRDSIEAGLYYKENFWTLIDTAGLRETLDSIEQEGIQRSYEEAHKADIIILVIDGSRRLSPQEHGVYTALFENYHHKIILVQNKADLPEAYDARSLPRTPLKVSCTDSSWSIIEQKIEEKINELTRQLESPFLLNKRHYNLLLGLEQKIIALLPLLTSLAIPYELVSYHLRDALECSSEMTGKSISEEALDKVFKEFCVGK
jgi:tRNA modification GTPase